MLYEAKVNEVSAHGANVYVSFRLLPKHPDDPANSSGATEDQVAQKARATAMLVQHDSARLAVALQEYIPADPLNEEASSPFPPAEQNEASTETVETGAPNNPDQSSDQ